MNDEFEMKRQEAKAYLSFVAGADSERAIDARSYHITRYFDAADFEELVETLERTESTASIAFHGRDAEERAETIEMVHDAGHEPTLHGHRHVKFGDLSYDEAHKNLSMGISAVEDATGITFTGFFAPFKEVSEGTLRAADDLGIEWILGKPETDDVPGSVTVVDSVYPHDTRLLEGGTPQDETFDQLLDAAEPGAIYLFHPNLLDYYEAADHFADWLEQVDATTVAEQVELRDGGMLGVGETDIELQTVADQLKNENGVGIVLDCLRPIWTR